MSAQPYIYRPLIERVEHCPRKVAIVEGVRAVGKTSMVRHELASGDRPQYSYETLADNDTFHQAKANIDEWVATLRLPCIIDEAQRNTDVLLAVKNRVDKLPASDFPLVILTGSAALSKSALNGQDPLARRSMRYTLYPLTQRELSHQALSIVDLLWSAVPNEDHHGSSDKDQIGRFIRLGGFPDYAIAPRRLASSDFRVGLQTDIDSVLGDTILPGERLDRTIAKHVLDQLLVVPSNILNVKRIADMIESNPVTVERYISIFMRRFLIGALKNLRSAPGKQPFTRAKIRPLDTSFTVEAWQQAGRDFTENPQLFGQVFESFVCNQIIPEIEWSDAHPDAFYWRETGETPHEVDLVLVHDRELVGIEVKSSTQAREEDFSGLYALKDWCQKQGLTFKRGYVVNAGSTIKRHSPSMWVLPASAFWESGSFLVPHDRDGHDRDSRIVMTAPTVSTNSSEEVGQTDMTAARIFLSYNHEDNDFLDGKIIRLIQDVAQRYEYENSQKLLLFIDRDSLTWGSDWKREIDKNLGMSTFVIPAITPRYMQSASCRQELLEFHSRVTQDRTVRILPLILQSVERVKRINPDNPIWPVIENTQYIDQVPDLKLASGREYSELVARITHALEAAVNQTIASSAPKSLTKVSGESKSHAGDNQHDRAETKSQAIDFLGIGIRLEKLTPEFTVAFQHFWDNLQKVSGSTAAMSTPQVASFQELARWANQFAEKVQPEVDELEMSKRRLSDKWKEIYGLLSQYVDAVTAVDPDSDEAHSLKDNALSTLDNLETSLQIPDSIQPSLVQMRTTGSLIAPLRPLMQSLIGSVSNIDDMRMMVHALREKAQASF